MTVKQTFILDDESIFNTKLDIIIDLIPLIMYMRVRYGCSTVFVRKYVCAGFGMCEVERRMQLAITDS